MLLTNSKISQNLKSLIHLRKSNIFYKVRDNFIEESLALSDNAKENYNFLMEVVGYYTDPFNFRLKDPKTIDVEIVNLYIDITEDMKDVAPHNLQKVYNFLELV